MIALAGEIFDDLIRSDPSQVTSAYMSVKLTPIIYRPFVL